MNLAAEAPQWLALIFAGLLIAAAVQDALEARMSNLLVLLLIAGAGQMLFATVLSGGVLALLVLGARIVKWGEAAQRRLPFLRPKAGVPYGIAIAAGALIAMALQR